MKENTYISTYVNQTQVKGYIVSAERQVLIVEIISPLRGITGQTIKIPKDFNQWYLDSKGYVTGRGKAAGERVLEEIYTGALFVVEKRDRLLQVYENYQRDNQHIQEGLIGEKQQEELLYTLFTYTIRAYHRKISYDIFRQLVKKIVLDT